ncbi:MAG: GNAT family N-acetyltransferase [Anaerovoracaceae bacterium]
MYRIISMRTEDARMIAEWKYPGIYSIYSMQNDPETIAELMNGEYYACMDEERRLMGYFCAGQSARIPAQRPYIDLHSESAFQWIDIGLGMRPELCGKGIGGGFMSAGMDYIRGQNPGCRLRLVVACFNRRAIALYEKMGFHIRETVTHSLSGREFFVMYEAGDVFPPTSRDESDGTSAIL